MSKILFLLHVLILVGFISTVSHAQKIPHEKKLRSSNVHLQTKEIAGSDMDELTAHAIIKAPPAKLWKIISKCDDYHKNMPSIASSKQLSVTNGVIRCELVVDLPFPMDDLRSVTDAKHTIK